MIAEWMQNYYGLIRAERISPPVASRVLAYASVALYEGLASATPSLRSLAGQLNGLDSLPRAEARRRYDPVLVALASERTVLDSLFAEGLPATKAALAVLSDSLTSARMSRGIGNEVAGRSSELGVRIGNAILVWAARDGFDSTRTKPWKPQVGPQYWLNDTPESDYVPQNLSAASDLVELNNPSASLKPASAGERALVVNRPKAGSIKSLKAINPAGATEPYWGTLRPFVLRTPDECVPPAPTEFSAKPGSAFYQEAMTDYDVSRTLTDEQRLIALYWADNPGQTGTPTGHWLSIGSQMISQLQLPADRAAELFVLGTIAQADAFITAWNEKFRRELIRPYTYIRRYIDPNWRTVITTPAFPEYPSGHSGQSAAAAGVFTALLGPVAFDDSTNLALGHPVRRFPSFQAAADEAAMSRLYAGIHYDMGNEGGKTLGRCVAAKVLERVHTRAAVR
ncbi:MAG TPA: vanadium-dependent haloperoxidase [Gemmatimonadales bacterium]|nr:vanadium-dependent haloperoxidase [Gemmatimonadales bacterium]